MSTYNDQMISANLLASLKHLKSLCSTFSQEAGSDELFNKCEQLYRDISKLQRNVFDMMEEQGWYAMKSDSITSIKKAYEKFKEKKSEL
jgi:hypothetical protein